VTYDGADRRGLSRPGRDVEIDQLPVLPGVIVRLMSLSSQSDELFEEVLAISRQDPGLAERAMSWTS